MSTKKIKRPRGRPPVFSHSDAIGIALKLFRQKGYDGVGIAELSKAIGIKPPSLYKAFRSKHGLFEAAVQRYIDEDGGFLVEALSGATDITQAVRNILVSAAKAYTQQPDQPGCLILDGTRNCTDAEARNTTLIQRRATKDYLKSVLSNLNARDADSLAEFILIAMTGMSGAARHGVSHKVLLQAAEHFAAAANISDLGTHS